MIARRFLIVGLGSMGKRRLRLLKEVYPQGIYSGVDSRKDRRLEASDSFGIECYESLSVAMEEFRPHALFACTSPLVHGKIVLDALGQGCFTFSELNLHPLLYDKIIERSRLCGRLAFLSSTLLYRNEIDWCVNHAEDAGAKLSYSYHVGQYLPDWHPWESIDDFFVAKRDTNACREIFAIQLPWLVRAFGDVESLSVESGVQLSLGLPYPDTYHCLLRHRGGHIGSLMIDVVSRQPVSHLRIVGDRGTITWLGTPDSLSFFDGEKKRSIPIKLTEDIQQDPNYAPVIMENPYKMEIIAFLNAMNGNPDNIRYSYEEDMKILRIVDEIERRGER